MLWTMTKPMAALGLTLGLMLAVAGCGSATEAASLQLVVAESGALVGVYGASSTAGVELELDWAMQLVNRRAAPCPVAIYRWVDSFPEPSGYLPRQADMGAEGWPTRWPAHGGAVLLDSAVVAGGDTVVFGPTLVDDAGEVVETVFGLAACDGATLELGVRVELGGVSGIRRIIEGLSLELWRLD